MEETYDVVFFKISQLVQEIDVEVSNVLESMSCLDIVQLGLPDSHVIRRRVDSAVDTLRRIGSYRTPSDKLDSLLKSITHLSEFHTDSSKNHAAKKTNDDIYLRLSRLNS
ncbi:hypothetical protein BX666DRAFT_1995991 [Dichotomocladium elegans]|nr:hypothetical protein BX666DRAFT_1995991 [Dichotomocladium elegans]